MSKVTVLVVDDQRLIREGIASLLDLQDGVHVAGTAKDGREAIQQTLELCPDVVLMDVRMPTMDGIAATREIRRRMPDCQVLMLTTFDDDEYIIKSLQAGAGGYLLKDIPAADLAQAVRMVHAGIYQLDPSALQSLIGRLDATASLVEEPVTDQLPKHGLTGRELQVLRLIATGATNREIAAELFVSEGTVKNHVSSILSRPGVRDRVQAALYAHQHHLL